MAEKQEEQPEFWIEDLMASRQQLARLDSEDVEKAVRGALVVYSALRDPTDNMSSCGCTIMAIREAGLSLCLERQREPCLWAWR